MARKHAVWIIALLIFVADRAIKLWVAHAMVPGQSIAVLPPVLWITYITNSGAAFSILRHGAPLFIAIGAIILIGEAWYVIRQSTLSRQLVVGMGLLGGGTVGNLWDRMVSGRVIDYIHFRFWAIFNLADAAIVVGIILVMMEFWRKDAAHDRRTGV